MSYVIIKTDGTILTTIPDGTINTTSTPLDLPGRLYPGYGQVVDTNFVHALENFASAYPPTNALKGQLWYDTGSSTLKVCPADGETNAAAWYSLVTSSASQNASFGNLALSGNIAANNGTFGNQINANIANVNYLTVQIQANIANANVTGNAELANVITTNLTTGATSTSGNMTGVWTLTGSGIANGAAGTAMWITGGNLLTTGIKTDNFYYANGSPVNFGGTYGNSNVTAYLPTYTGNVGVAGGASAFNGNVLSTGSSATAGTLTGAWTLSPGSTLTGLSDISAANIVGTVSSASTAITAVTVTGAAQPNITSVGTLSSLSAAGAITAQRFVSTIATGTAPLTVSSTTKVANLNADLLDGYDAATAATSSTIVLRDPTGNITGNYIIGNGAYLTGLNIGTITSIASGTSNIAIPTTNGNVNIGIGGTPNVAVVSPGGLVIAGNVNASNIVASGGIYGSLATGSQPGITSVGTLSSLTVSGNVSAGNVNGKFYGNAVGLTNIPAANINGTVDNANYATYAGAIILSSQPNITSLGTLTSLNATGNITSSSYVKATYFQGDGSGLTNISVGAGTSLVNGTSNVKVDSSSDVRISVAGTPNVFWVDPAGIHIDGMVNATGAFMGPATGLYSIPGGNVSGTVSSATTATRAGTVTTAAQPNITSVGTLTSVNSSGNITASGNVSAAFLLGDGGFISNLSAPVITSLTNGTSNIAVDPSGNIRASISGTNNVLVIRSSGINVAGTLSTTGTITGNGSGLSSLNGSNVTGTVSTAGYASEAGTVVNGTQSNITAVGTLTSLSVTGNISAGNVNATHYGSGAGLTSLPGANVTGTVGAASTAYSVAWGNVSGRPTAVSAFTNDAGYLTTPFPAGTTMLFVQAAAPTGWTRLTSYNDAALRVVSSGGGASGGTVNFSAAFTSQSVSGTVGDTTLTVSQIPSHTHTGRLGVSYGGEWKGYLGFEEGRGSPDWQAGDMSPIGGGQPHNHGFSGSTINLAVKYVDAIVASKN